MGVVSQSFKFTMMGIADLSLRRGNIRDKHTRSTRGLSLTLETTEDTISSKAGRGLGNLENNC